jgi:3-oxoadipate enol-lactonase
MTPGLHWHEGGHGAPVLLLNGWTASGLVWPAALVERLERRFRVIRPDNRGSGWSRSAPAPFTLEDLADDARGILYQLGAERVRVLGFSMGGMIAQVLARRDPELVERLVLVSTSPPSPAHISASDATTWEMFRRRGRNQSLADYLRELWTMAAGHELAEQRPAIIDELVGQLLDRPTPRGGAMAQARAAGTWHGTGQLARITAPTVVVHGRKDVLRPVGNGMRLARLIRTAEYVELRGAGHLVPYEDADLLCELLESEDLPATLASRAASTAQTAPAFGQ